MKDAQRTYPPGESAADHQLGTDAELTVNNYCSTVEVAFHARVTTESHCDLNTKKANKAKAVQLFPRSVLR
ncbi:hypothetical protein KC324_g87 [Hortaea werneckii]|nr:hypothetical protein KC324_g87 [Hortaea werneckii]